MIQIISFNFSPCFRLLCLEEKCSMVYCHVISGHGLNRKWAVLPCMEFYFSWEVWWGLGLPLGTHLSGVTIFKYLVGSKGLICIGMDRKLKIWTSTQETFLANKRSNFKMLVFRLCLRAFLSALPFILTNRFRC